MPATLDAVPEGTRVRALLSTEAQLALRDSLGLDLRELDGTLVAREESRLLFQVRTASGSRAFGEQPLYQRIGVSPADVLRVDARRVNGFKTGVLVVAIAGAAALLTLEALGKLFPGTPDGGGNPPPDQIVGW